MYNKYEFCSIKVFDKKLVLCKFFPSADLLLSFARILILFGVIFNYKLKAIGLLIFILASIGSFDYVLAKPVLDDLNLTDELVVSGLKSPTSMAFLGPDDILVLEKNNGTVQRIVNGVILPQPLLDVNVASQSERGMLGIAVAKNNSNVTSGPATFVFLYYTEAQSKDGEDLTAKKDPLGNRLYRYEFLNVENKLVNPKLLLDLPAGPGFSHNGGVVTLGPDNNVYVVVGDLNYRNISSGNTLTQNIDRSRLPDGRGGILRITQNGETVGGGESILGNEDPLNKYYAYGIRNSFGIAFDPLTGKLWETENGSKHGDEINLVLPGFNGGWRLVSGLSSSPLNNNTLHREKLVDFDGRGNYSEPELDWQEEVGPTAIAFLGSDKYGKQYENDIFIGSAHHNGTIYHFDLTQDRTELILDGPLADKIVEEESQLKDLTFAEDFGVITDLEVGPYDGYLYVVAFEQGSIYRIVPGSNGYDGIATTTATTTPSPAATTNTTKLSTEENKTANVLYHYEPYMTFRGDNFFDIPSNSTLQLTNFTTAFWFRTGLLNTTDMNTSTVNSTTNTTTTNQSSQFIINKGGTGSDKPGKNMNYGMYISTDDGIVRSGFEGINGTRYFVSSEAPVNDTQWHYAVTTHDGSVVRLYIDGIEQGAEVTGGAIPDNTNNTLPLRIGANSNKENRYFIGNIDEVRIWNRALTPSEVKQAYEEGVSNVQGQVVYLPFESSLSQNQNQSQK